MTRIAIPRLALLCTVCAALASCSGRTSYGSGSGLSSSSATEADTGDVSFELYIPSGIVLSSVEYVLDGPASARVSGALAVAPGASTATLLIPALSPVASYTVTFEASAGQYFCLGGSTFTPLPGQTLTIPTSLECHSTVHGGPRIVGVFNNCPVVTSLITSAMQGQGFDPGRAPPATLGIPISVAAAGEDADNNPLTFSWTSEPAGTFSDPSAATTQFTCLAVGSTKLTVTIDDGQGCQTLASVAITCFAPPQ